MSEFTKTEGTQAIWDILSEATYEYDDPYTLAIEPEIYSEDGETFIYLNLVVISRNSHAIYSQVGSVSVELGRYNSDDEKTELKARNKAMKAAKEFDLYVTEVVE